MIKIKRNTILFTLALLFIAPNVFACGSDAECANDEICNDAGQCEPDGRDWKTLKSELLNFQKSSTINKDHPDMESVDLPITDKVQSHEQFNKGIKSQPICGLLEFRRREGRVLVYLGVGYGQLTVNFSKNGRITSRIGERVSRDNWYRYDPGTGSVGFTCS